MVVGLDPSDTDSSNLDALFLSVFDLYTYTHRIVHTNIPHAQHQPQQPLHNEDVKLELIPLQLCQYDAHYAKHE